MPTGQSSEIMAISPGAQGIGVRKLCEEVYAPPGIFWIGKGVRNTV